MEAAGFHVERILEFNRALRPAWFIGARVWRLRSLNARQVRWFDRFVWLTRPLDRHLPWPATCLIAIGEKA
jgi:hypothetical protein